MEFNEDWHNTQISMTQSEMNAVINYLSAPIPYLDSFFQDKVDATVKSMQSFVFVSDVVWVGFAPGYRKVYELIKARFGETNFDKKINLGI